MAKPYTPKRGDFAGQTFESYYYYRMARNEASGRGTVYQERVRRAIKQGYTSYPEKRSVRANIRKENDRLRSLGIPIGKIDARTKEGANKMRLLERAYKYIRKHNLSGERGAKKQLPEKLKKQIRELYTDENGNVLSAYYPLMRSLY